MQNKRNSIEDGDDVKLLLAYMKKMQNTAKVGILVNDEIALSTKGAVGRKRIDVSIRKVIYITS